MLMHSYSSVPGSAAAAGLGKSERAKQGKKTGVIGQIYLASILTKGGDGKDIVGAFGGHYPPHIRPDVGTSFPSFTIVYADVVCYSLKQICFAAMTALDRSTRMRQKIW